jgi:hypothetical protein
MQTALVIRVVIVTPPNPEYAHFKRPYVPIEMQTHFPINGPKPEHFTLTASDYDVGDDMIVCPCGDEIGRESTLGGMLKQARKHIKEKHSR